MRRLIDAQFASLLQAAGEKFRAEDILAFPAA
jgi:hypothetical protein